MKIFGKRQERKEKKQKSEMKTIRHKTLRPADVKVFYTMPILLFVGILCIVTGLGFVVKNKTDYSQKILASSMQYGQDLPLWGGTTVGTLRLGNTMLSKDEKTFVVEILYDDSAHKNLSSFGDRYKLRLVDTKDNPMDVDMSYGLFGTDGSGVIRIHSESGFANKAFIVMIIDNGQLVSSDDLTSNSIMTDSELNKSITAQLSNMDQIQENNQGEKEKLPPLYYVRLNPYSSNKSDANWSNDRQIVEDLFVTKNLQQIEKELENIKEKIKKGKYTLEEMDQRIKENPNDNIAISQKQTLENSLTNLKKQEEIAKKNFKHIKDGAIKKNVLEPKQTEHEIFTITDINKMS